MDIFARSNIICTSKQQSEKKVILHIKKYVCGVGMGVGGGEGGGGGGGRTTDLGALRTPGDFFFFFFFNSFLVLLTFVFVCCGFQTGCELSWLRFLRLKQTIIKEAGYADLFSYAHNGTHKNERKLVKTGC